MARYATYVIKECSASSLQCKENDLACEPGVEVQVAWDDQNNLSVRFLNSEMPGRLFKAVQRPAQGNGIAFDVVGGQESPVRFHVKRKFVMRPVSARSTSIARRT